MTAICGSRRLLFGFDNSADRVMSLVNPHNTGRFLNFFTFIVIRSWPAAGCYSEKLAVDCGHVRKKTPSFLIVQFNRLSMNVTHSTLVSLQADCVCLVSTSLRPIQVALLFGVGLTH